MLRLGRRLMQKVLTSHLVLKVKDAEDIVLLCVSSADCDFFIFFFLIS